MAPSFIESGFSTRVEYEQSLAGTPSGVFSATGVQPFSKDLTVYYWPMMGRAGAVMRMLDYAGVPYKHKSEFGEIASVCGAFGAQTTVFAPPVVVDGDYKISQSTAIAMYVGKKCGLTKGMDEDKALQILADLIDTFENGIGAAADKGGSALKQFFEDGKPSRFAKLMGNIERNIQGPYFFGASLTVPDFVLAALTDWQDFTKLEVRIHGHEPSGGERRRALSLLTPLLLFSCGEQRLKKEKGFDPWSGYPKAAAVVAAVRALPSYKANQLQVVRDGFYAKDELFAAYK
jgi:glutathione S-transferase